MVGDPSFFFNGGGGEGTDIVAVDSTQPISNEHISIMCFYT